MMRHAVRLFDVLLLFGAVAVMWHVRTGAGTAEPKRATLGAPLQLESVDWRAAPRHVVLAVSTSCLATTANLKFYASLLAAAKAATPAVPVVVVSPESRATIAAWLGKATADQPSAFVRVSEMRSLGIVQVPTLMLVDRRGRITDVMERRLNEANQAAVLDRIRDPHTAPLYNVRVFSQVQARDVGEWIARKQAQIVNVAERGTRSRSSVRPHLSIPSDELMERGPVEVSRDRPVLVDCTDTDQAACRLAGIALQNVLATDVYWFVTP
jgi:hypothetical protein